MSWSAKSLALPLVLLCLWGLQEGTRACKCVSRHPQEAFCQSDVAIKAKVVGKVDTTLNPIKYRIKQIKMFKGPEKRFCYFYTEPDSAACGVNLSNNTEYLLSGVASACHLQVNARIFCQFLRRMPFLTRPLAGWGGGGGLDVDEKLLCTRAAGISNSNCFV
ncbi:metalloproteinase inhibitor 2-like isoform X2 [Syngnathoides biaculeatus]|uniref:metalloproteinase inhibitor 2-like isoform X2 n=1 Tax=Syngnathoides biaculeatus TaxID=300417 RepID=UPI002ADDE697|nr:metalloproteinase inhibitor 2-like isoform X2 [Syngnathoides biaculeatus]